MISSDYVKDNKKDLRIKEIQGDMLKHWIKNGTGRNARKKVLLVDNSGLKKIEKQVANEIVALILNRKRFEKQKEAVVHRLAIAKRFEAKTAREQGNKEALKLAEKLDNEMGTELSAFDIERIAQRVKNWRKNRSIFEYLNVLGQEKRGEEVLEIERKNINATKIVVAKQKDKTIPQQKEKSEIPSPQEVMNQGVDASDF